MSENAINSDFAVTDSLVRELSRIDRFLRFGTELNAINFDRKSSFNAFLESNEAKRAPKSTSLKSVKNLWLSVQTRPEGQQKSLADAIRAVVDRSAPHLYAHSLPVLIRSLFDAQSAGKAQSPLRALAISLLSCEHFLPTHVLVLAHVFGRKRLDSSIILRHTLSEYYLRKDFNSKQIEEILVFKRSLDWSHRDVIKLCHIKPNALTQQLLRNKKKESSGEGDEPLLATEQRLRVLRSNKSKPHEVVAALDDSELDPNYWFRVLNSSYRNNAVIWRKVLENVSEDQLIRLVPAVISKFPNNRSLFDLIISRLSDKNCKFLSNFSRFLVLFYCEKNFLKINSNLMQKLTNSLKVTRIDKQFEEQILLVFDKQIDSQKKFLFGHKDKKRKKEDLLDSMLIMDLIKVLVQSFNCVVSSNANFKPFDPNLIQDLDELEFPFTQLSAQMRRRVIFVTESQQDISEWPKDSKEKLIVLHMNKRELKNLGYYRQNVLISNGFDIRLEPIIAQFFAAEEQPMETN